MTPDLLQGAVWGMQHFVTVLVTATALQNELQNANGTRISTQTIRNRLHRAGMRAT